MAWVARFEVERDGFSHVLRGRPNYFPLRDTSGDLRHVSDVAVVLGIEDQVHKKLAGLSCKRILQQKRRRELKICSIQEC